MDFADRLKQARKDSGMTQKELAKRVGMNYRLISRYEQGTMEPSVGRAIKMAEVLGFSPYDKPGTSMEAVVGGYENDLELMRDDCANLRIRDAQVRADLDEAHAELKAERDMHAEEIARMQRKALKYLDAYNKAMAEANKFKHIAFNLYVKR